MARATRAKRTRSTFKKSSGTLLSLQPKFNIRTSDKETTVEEHRRPSGGYGYFNNKCMCKSCRGGRY
mgnify:CR=1 FL=1